MSTVIEMDIESTRPQIYCWAYRLLHNHHDALDATQSVLLKVLQAGRPRHEKAWLRAVTINHCIDHMRRNERKARLSQVTADQPVCSDRPADSAAAEDAERHRLVRAALAELTDMQRAVLLAKTFDGETFQHIAASMNLSASSVKTHYLRAVRKMRDMLKNTMEADHGNS